MRMSFRPSLTLCCGLAAILITWAAGRTPAPQRADAPATTFSADRAMLDVATIAKQPHPTGSAEAGQVRAHLIDRLRTLGLSAEVQHGSSVTVKGGPRGPMVSGAAVENVIGVLPGDRHDLPALAIMAHYDTVAGSPGAADDGAGVASMLEVARALRAGSTLSRDVIFLFTDAEEAGLLGARAFFDNHPLAQRIGLVLNLEARGSSGLAMMFETSAGAGPLVRLFADAVDKPIANSLMNHVYRRLPNGTDLTVPKDHGIAGLNLAFVGTQFDYHAPSATAENLNRGSIQHMGEQTLALVRRLANQAEWPAAQSELVYSDLLGLFLVAYPTWVGWLILGAALVLATITLIRARHHQPVRGRSLARGFAVALCALIIAAIVVRLTFRMLGAGSGAALLQGRETLAQFPLFMAAEAALAIGTLLLCLTSSARWPGLMLLALLGAVLLQIFAAPVAFLIAWPLLAAALTSTILALGTPASGKPFLTVVAAAIATLGAAQSAHLGHQLFVGVGFGLPEVIVPSAALGLLPLLALAHFSGEWSRERDWSVLAITSAGVALLFVVALRDPTDPRFPRPTQLFHITDMRTGRSQFASALPDLDSWTRSALLSHGGSLSRASLPELLVEQAWVAPAKPIQHVPIQVDISASQGNRTVLQIEAPNTREFRLSLRATMAIRNVRLEQHPVDLLSRPGEPARIRWQGGGRLALSFDTPARGSLEVSIAGLNDQPPASSWPLPPMPLDIRPWGVSHLSVVVTELRHSW